MLIIKLLWRLDYSASYAYLDKRGSALNILSETVDGFWQNVGLGAIPTSLAANYGDARVYRNISLELYSMNGSIEWTSGIDAERVLTDDAFRGTDKIVRELLRLCDIRIMTRVGVRVVCIAKFKGHRGEGLKRTLAMLGGEILSKVDGGLGDIEDIALTFEGKSKDEVSFRAVLGPYARKNAEATFQRKLDPDQYRFFDENDLYFDIDLFENNISFAEHSLYRWTGTKIAKAIDFINIVSDN